MYEVEMKFAIADPLAIREQLLRLGGIVQPVRERHRDTYYGHPCRDFAETTEALRIRSVHDDANKGDARITYKGPKQPGVAKVREELEWSLGSGDVEGKKMAAMLVALGFQPVATVEKHRETWGVCCLGQALHVTLDEVTELGWYSEIEAMAADEGQIAAAKDAVIHFAGELGLREHEQRSYLKLWLNSRKLARKD